MASSMCRQFRVLTKTVNILRRLQLNVRCNHVRFLSSTPDSSDETKPPTSEKNVKFKSGQIKKATKPSSPKSPDLDRKMVKAAKAAAKSVNKGTEADLKTLLAQLKKIDDKKQTINKQSPIRKATDTSAMDPPSIDMHKLKSSTDAAAGTEKTDGKGKKDKFDFNDLLTGMMPTRRDPRSDSRRPPFADQQGQRPRGRFTPGEQGQRFTPGEQGQPFTPREQGQRFTPRQHGQRFTPGQKGQRFTPGQQPRMQGRTQLPPVQTVDIDSIFNFDEGKRLNIFPKVLEQEKDLGRPQNVWDEKIEREKDLFTYVQPSNGFEEWMKWTQEGRLFKFPIDNEQDWDYEADVPFYEHVFLERRIQDTKPEAVRNFLALVCNGLSKNPWFTAQEKLEHIDWFKSYFVEKAPLMMSLSEAVKEGHADLSGFDIGSDMEEEEEDDDDDKSGDSSSGSESDSDSKDGESSSDSESDSDSEDKKN